MKLLRKWGYQCVVCGREFANVACVTVEHINPLSKDGRNNKTNTGPSHWRCNHLKGTRSLLVTAKRIDAAECKMKNHKQFIAWLNNQVPRREVPHYALLPVIDAEWFY